MFKILIFLCHLYLSNKSIYINKYTYTQTFLSPKHKMYFIIKSYISI